MGAGDSNFSLVETFQYGLSQYFLRGSIMNHQTFFQQDDSVGVARGQVKVVQHATDVKVSFLYQLA